MRIGILGMAALLALGVGSAHGQSILIDDFSTDQALIFANGGFDESNANGGGIIGGSRDARVIGDAQFEADGGTGFFSRFNNVSGLTGLDTIVWDGGTDESSNEFNLGGVDLTDGGIADAFLVQVLGIDNDSTFAITLFEDGSNYTEVTGISLTEPGDILVPFSDFTDTVGSGADFTSVEAIQREFLFIDPNAPNIEIDEISTVNFANASVPEPTTAGLLSLLGIFCFSRRRRR